jgi:nicotinamidase-related amidase
MRRTSGKDQGFGTATPRPDTALLVVDMVNPFDFPGADALVRPALRAARAIRALRDRFDRASAPVVYVNDNFMRWQADFRDLLALCQQPDAPARPIVALLSPGPAHYYILKPKHSAFMDTPLEVLLAQLQVRRLVLTGIATDSCIVATAHDAHMREFPLWVPADCTAAEAPSRKRRALELVRDALSATVRPSRPPPRPKGSA